MTKGMSGFKAFLVLIFSLIVVFSILFFVSILDSRKVAIKIKAFKNGKELVCFKENSSGIYSKGMIPYAIVNNKVASFSKNTFFLIMKKSNKSIDLRHCKLKSDLILE